MTLSTEQARSLAIGALNEACRAMSQEEKDKIDLGPVVRAILEGERGHVPRLSQRDFWRRAALAPMGRAPVVEVLPDASHRLTLSVHESGWIFRSTFPRRSGLWIRSVEHVGRVIVAGPRVLAEHAEAWPLRVYAGQALTVEVFAPGPAKGARPVWIDAFGIRHADVLRVLSDPILGEYLCYRHRHVATEMKEWLGQQVPMCEASPIGWVFFLAMLFGRKT